MITSDKFLTRTAQLRKQGYDTTWVMYPRDLLQLRVTKGDIKAARMFSMEELETVNMDLLLYTLERLVENIDNYKENKNEH